MAVGMRDSFTIFNPELYHTTQLQEIALNLDAFNAASRNALVLRDRRIVGNYTQETILDLVDPIDERDLTSNSAQTSSTLTDDSQIGIKKYMKIVPYEMTLDAWRAKGLTVNDFSAAFARTVTQRKLASTLTLALAALIGKLSNTAANTLDITGESNDSLKHSALARALALFGDQYANIVCWAMHSKAFFDLVGDAITMAIPGLTDVVVFGGSPGTFNRPVVVSDCMTYTDNSSGDDVYYTLGLTPNAMVCEQSEPDDISEQLKLGTEQMTHIIQGEYAINFKMRGAICAVGTVASNPTAVQLATYTNWTDIWASAPKLRAGVCIKHN